MFSKFTNKFTENISVFTDIFTEFTDKNLLEWWEAVSSVAN